MTSLPVVGVLTDRLTSMLYDKFSEEVTLITSFKKDFELLREELVFIKCLLNDAGENRNTRSMSHWIDRLKSFLHEAVETVENCREGGKFCNPLFRYSMGRKIRMLKEKMRNIHESAKYLQYATSILDVNARGQEPSIACNSIRKRENGSARRQIIFGRYEEIEKITKLLLQEDSVDVVLVGERGVGKTLLMQHVFNSKKVRDDFGHRVWLRVSQNLTVKELLLEIHRKIQGQMNSHENRNPTKLSEKNLRSVILGDLKETKCLFALDDIQEKYTWEKIGLGLPNSNMKLMMTTCDEELRKNIAGNIYPINALSEKHSRTLFNFHAFPVRQKGQEVKKDQNEVAKRVVAKKVVEKCGGMPLGIKTIGACLHHLELGEDWKRTLQDFEEAAVLSHRVMPSLWLSYKHLPDILKRCFLYFSVFPRNYDVDCQNLLHVWIAEGVFMERSIHDYNQDAEAEKEYLVGQWCIDALIDRCLIEVSEYDADGMAKRCRMHNLLHDLAVSETLKQTKCLLQPGKALKQLPESLQQTRCLIKPWAALKNPLAQEYVDLHTISLIQNDISTIKDAIECPRLSSFILSHNIHLKSVSERFFKTMKHLTVLDLSWTSIRHLPKSLRKLKYLKFLNLSHTEISKLPEFFSGLWRLQFLDVSYCRRLRNLHSGIANHASMQYLNVEGCERLGCLPAGVSKLTYLRTLKGAVFEDRKKISKAIDAAVKLDKAAKATSIALQFGDLKELTLLQHLSLRVDAENIKEIDAERIDAPASSAESIIQVREGIFGGMKRMMTLSFENTSSGTLLRFPWDMKAMDGLKIVHVRGCPVTKRFVHLQNLIELHLDGDNSSGADYKGLERLPSLRKLRLSNNKKCVEFPDEFFKDQAFPELEELTIENFERLQYFPCIREREDAMQNLKKLVILPEISGDPCSRIRSQPVESLGLAHSE